MNGWRTLFPNALYIAAREYRGRVRARSFVLGTLVLAAIVLLGTQIPTIVDYVSGSTTTRLAVYAGASDLPPDTMANLDQWLNGPTSTSYAGGQFIVTPVADEATAEQELEAGKYDALLVIQRNAQTHDLTFTLRANITSDGRQAAQAQAVVNLLAYEDRLARAGISMSAAQAQAPLEIVPIKGSGSSSAAPGSDAAPKSTTDEISASLISTGLIVLIFMAIITYGTWVAMSVAEEKGSRVMELMLNATTPLQMLAGKVIGNGAAGLTQYGAIIATGIVGMVAQGPIREAVLGSSGSGTPFSGLTLTLFGAFIVLFLLGFLLYALLYAALGSLVTRQEDIQSATAPLMMLIMAGYFLSVFALQAINDTWVVLLSFVPFFSPYLMLARIAVGHVEPWEFGLTLAIMLASAGVALFVAARIYSAGVLLYGQRVGLRQVLSAARVSR